MTTINQNPNLKQMEDNTWLSTYLPAICAATIMAVVLFVAVSCSKKADKPVAKMTPPAAPEMSSPAPSNTPAPLSAAPKKVKNHRPANATYVSGTYGVSFSYPRKYSLQAGDGKSPSPVQAGFVKPGAQQIAAVDLPGDSYPETDFSAALLNVSVNSGMTEEECAQFVPDSKDANAPKPTTVKLGANEFTEIEQMSGEPEHQSDLKYFHLFKNGACYEFALDVETSRKADEELAQVDRGKVFQQLEKILTTARVKDVAIPGVENAQKTVSTDAKITADSKSAPGSKPAPDAKAAPDSKAEKAQVVNPTGQK